MSSNVETKTKKSLSSNHEKASLFCDAFNELKLSCNNTCSTSDIKDNVDKNIKSNTPYYYAPIPSQMLNPTVNNNNNASNNQSLALMGADGSYYNYSNDSNKISTNSTNPIPQNFNPYNLNHRYHESLSTNYDSIAATPNSDYLPSYSLNSIAINHNNNNNNSIGNTSLDNSGSLNTLSPPMASGPYNKFNISNITTTNNSTVNSNVDSNKNNLINSNNNNNNNNNNDLMNNFNRKPNLLLVPRYYANVCIENPAEYSCWEMSMDDDFLNNEKFYFRKDNIIGSGKYSHIWKIETNYHPYAYDKINHLASERKKWKSNLLNNQLLENNNDLNDNNSNKDNKKKNHSVIKQEQRGCSSNTDTSEGSSSEEYIVSKESEIIFEIENSKFADIARNLNLDKNTGKKYFNDIVIKELKTKSIKYKREIHVLKKLSIHQNIVDFLGAVFLDDEYTGGNVCLIFPYIHNPDWKVLFPSMTNKEFKNYFSQLLEALDFSHSHGIMHRDIKPHNILFDPRVHKLYLSDWGLAEYYFPMNAYPLKVCSRYYKPPEILLGCRNYHYAMDIWSCGCILAAWACGRPVMFTGGGDLGQLECILGVLGGVDFIKKWCETVGVWPSAEVRGVLRRWKGWNGVPFHRLGMGRGVNRWEWWEEGEDCGLGIDGLPEIQIDSSAESVLKEEDKLVLDLILSMLDLDPYTRISAKEALQHKWFSYNSDDSERPCDIKK